VEGPVLLHAGREQSRKPERERRRCRECQARPRVVGPRTSEGIGQPGTSVTQRGQLGLVRVSAQGKGGPEEPPYASGGEVGLALAEGAVLVQRGRGAEHAVD